MPSLKNKSIVIIGGTSGIGLSAARAFIEAGANVVATGIGDSVAQAAQALTESAVVIESDARAPDSASNAIATAQRTFGGFDGLYHVAGGSGRQWGDGPLHEATDEGWDETVRLNQTSVFYSNRAAARAFRESGRGGTVINVASVLAFSPSPEHFHTHVYAASKAAIIGLTQSAAAYYSKDNIRFNAIAPGLTDTPMAKRARTDEAIQAFVRSKQPLDGGRMASPEDLDGLAVLLLSDAAKFITGQVIAVDGGWSLNDGQIADS
jgi:NAD(P)-dependent dehydrogenase (short-subunit alcohol dehydrogenase family)